MLTNMNEASGCELIFLDFENDTGQVYRAPAGAGAWALREVSGDRLIVGTFYDGMFMVFDLKQMQFDTNHRISGRELHLGLGAGQRWSSVWRHLRRRQAAAPWILKPTK